MILTTFTFSAENVNAASENSSKTLLDNAAGLFDGTNCEDYAYGAYEASLTYTNGDQNQANYIYDTAFNDCMSNGGYSNYTVVIKSKKLKAD